MPKNWCPEVYKGAYIDRFNDDTIIVSPCCNAARIREPLNTYDFKTSPYLNEIRQAFDRDEQHPACRRCWDAESAGQRSRRQNNIDFFSSKLNDTAVVLESVDYAATWACNLACVMCSPVFSSTWASELDLNRSELKNIGKLYQKQNSIMEKIDFSAVSRLHLNGGEPMLNNDQISIFEQVDRYHRLSNLTVSYNTNGTVFPSEKIIDLWKKTKWVRLFFSIDATDAAYNYVRYPSDWQKTAENLLAMKEQLPSNVMFGMNLAVGCYNIFEVADVWRWFEQNLKTNREGDASDFAWQFVYQSELKYLSKSAKQGAIKHLQDLPVFQGLVQHLKDTIDSPEDTNWINMLDTADQRRGTDWRKTFRIAEYY